MRKEEMFLGYKMVCQAVSYQYVLREQKPCGHIDNTARHVNLPLQSCIGCPSWGLNAHAVEERPSTSGVGVRIAGRARLPDDVRGHERERRRQIRAPLQKIV